MKIVVVFLFIFLNYNVEVVLSQMCNGAPTCQACYAIPGCAWCSASTITDINDRCFPAPADDESSPSCAANDIHNEKGSVQLDELDLTDDNQISIRRAKVHLRAGETQSFQFNVRAAENFPLDLYLIVDLSFTLLDELATIKNISNEIAESLRNISTRFQIGFGSYVDKISPPYVPLSSFDLPFDTLGMPSACINDVCRTPFSFVHDINLTNSSESFADQLAPISISTNADNPEGTFDAIAQAVLCTDIVGWRENSRKIIVVITDALIHMAGDGILAGIVRPAPNECRTKFDPSTDTYTYVDNLEFDYPSVEQIRQILEDNLVSPVLAVQELEEYYEPLLEAWSSLRAQRVELEDGANNIINALETAYNNIVSEVRLSYNVGNDQLTITNSVECPNGTVANPDGMSCSSVVTNQTITFTVDVTLLNCTGFVSGSKVVNVNIPGYGRLEIEVEGICTCDCEMNGVPNSPLCSGNGTRACGICNCDEGWSGDMCSCRTEEIDSLNCLTGVNGAECSNRGDCECGECQCRVDGDIVIDNNFSPPRYNLTSPLITGVAVLVEVPRGFGEACECTNYLCDRADNGLVCSGNQGNCTCDGNCNCSTIEYGNLPYTGTSCQCNVAFCYNQSIPFSPNNLPCNDNGICNSCNRQEPCNCEPGFVPPYCVPSTLALRQCFGSGSNGRSCVQCYADNSDDPAECQPSCDTGNSVYSLVMGSVGDDLEGSLNDTTRECSFITADPICTYRYYVAIAEESTTTNQIQIIQVEPNTDCFPLRWWHLALILLGSLIILGIIILVIVKIIFMILDYREVKHLAKSVAETDLSKNFNPLYQSPEVKYDNVAFGKE